MTLAVKISHLFEVVMYGLIVAEIGGLILVLYVFIDTQFFR